MYDKSLLSTILELAPNAIIVVDNEQRIILFNRSAENIFGYKAEEVFGKPLDILLPPTAIDVHRDQVNHFVREGYASRRMEERGHKGSLQGRRKDGSLFPIEVSIGVIPYAKGRIAVAIVHDISERVQTEKRLRVLAEQYQTMISAPLFGFRLINENGIIEDVNETYCKMSGYTREELLGQSIAALEAQLSEEEVVQLLDNIREVGTGHFETKHKAKDGRVFDVEITTSYWPSQQKYIAFIYDITERKRAQEQLVLNEERFRALIENSADGIFIIDERGEITYRSPAVFRMIGFRPDESAERAPFDFIHPEDRLYAQERFQKLIVEPGTTQHFQMRVLHTDGTWHWFEGHGTSMFHHPAIRGLVLNVRDVTERKERQEKQRQLQEYIQAQELTMHEILEAIPEGILVIDDRGRVLIANPAAEENLQALAGVSVGEIITHLGDRTLYELLTSPTQGHWHEVKLDERIFEVATRPLHKEGEAEHWVLIIDEVTEQRLAQKQLYQQERLAAVGQLASGIAHDFNNIMAVIVLYAQLVARRKNIPETEQEWIKIINQQAWHATRLIQQILDFSRQAVLSTQPLNLLPLLKEQVKLLQRTLPSSIEIEFGYDTEAEYWLEADPTRMQQMLTNLAINARDAMPEGGILCINLERIIYDPETSPSVAGLEPGVWIKLMVSDTGTGISPEVLKHLFEPFYTTKAPGEGTGLGLAQVYGIVSQHGGLIDVKSEEGKGTSFIIYLPALQTHAESQPSLEKSPEIRGHGEKILLVEDGAAIRTAMV
ncbi:MAG: PAS domain S-box protein, partial [Chloroflexi bacterium]|nr:PAS domain S-box protein [Chloroflexota bacterium]